MPILNAEDIEPYKAFRIIGLKSLNEVSKADLKRLQRTEERLLKEGADYGLPYLVALQYHTQDTSLNELDRKYGVCGGAIGSMLIYFGFQKLSLSEAISGGRKKAASPLTNTDRRKILKLYDAVAGSLETEEEISDAISKKTGLEKKHIEEFLERQHLE